MRSRHEADAFAQHGASPGRRLGAEALKHCRLCARVRRQFMCAIEMRTIFRSHHLQNAHDRVRAKFRDQVAVSPLAKARRHPVSQEAPDGVGRSPGGLGSADRLNIPRPVVFAVPGDLRSVGWLAHQRPVVSRLAKSVCRSM